MSGRLTRLALRAMDKAAKVALRPPKQPQHLETGRRGEELAYFYLRRMGYVIVARNYRSRRQPSEIDLVGWDGDVLCFIEVKTRTKEKAKKEHLQLGGAELPPAEAAVDRDKRRELAAVARDYAAKMRQRPPLRFDIVSVYSDQSGTAEITLFKNAFPMP